MTFTVRTFQQSIRRAFHGTQRNTLAVAANSSGQPVNLTTSLSETNQTIRPIIKIPHLKTTDPVASSSSSGTNPSSTSQSPSSQSSIQQLMNIPWNNLPRDIQGPSMTLAATLALPKPLPSMISLRLNFIRKVEVLTDKLQARKVAITDVLDDLDAVRLQVMELGTQILGERGRTIKDFTWGMDPSMGLVDEEESREALMDELTEMKAGLVREVGQLFVVGMEMAEKKRKNRSTHGSAPMGAR
ncbi:hypothetical protein HDU76_005020 [Blyttiomyces sp. JEL0837]|nr:hypothetical protein HDU76_005020 [Blyttiomyces sp. JEL0837]